MSPRRAHERAPRRRAWPSGMPRARTGCVHRRTTMLKCFDWVHPQFQSGHYGGRLSDQSPSPRARIEAPSPSQAARKSFRSEPDCWTSARLPKADVSDSEPMLAEGQIPTWDTKSELVGLGLEDWVKGTLHRRRCSSVPTFAMAARFIPPFGGQKSWQSSVYWRIAADFPVPRGSARAPVRAVALCALAAPSPRSASAFFRSTRATAVRVRPSTPKCSIGVTSISRGYLETWALVLPLEITAVSA